MCFAVPEKEVKAVAEALKSRFRQALDAGRLSQVWSTSYIRILGLTTSCIKNFIIHLKQLYCAFLGASWFIGFSPGK